MVLKIISWMMVRGCAYNLVFKARGGPIFSFHLPVRRCSVSVVSFVPGPHWRCLSFEARSLESPVQLSEPLEDRLHARSGSAPEGPGTTCSCCLAHEPVLKNSGPYFLELVALIILSLDPACRFCVVPKCVLDHHGGGVNTNVHIHLRCTNGLVALPPGCHAEGRQIDPLRSTRWSRGFWRLRKVPNLTSVGKLVLTSSAQLGTYFSSQFPWHSLCT